MVVIAFAATATVVAAVITTILLLRAAGGPIHVLFTSGVDAQPYRLLAAELRAVPETAEFRIMSAAARSEEDVDVLVYDGSPGVSPVRKPSLRIEPPDDVVAVDPYVMVADQRAAATFPAGPGSTIDELGSRLQGLNRDRWIPLVVSGNNPEDFAAFLLYMAEAALSPTEFTRFTELLEGAGAGAGESAGGNEGSADGRAVDETVVREAVATAEPLVRMLEEWKEAGILVFNWTNWDRLALETAQEQGRAALSFQRRSLLKTRSRSERFHLRMLLPPVPGGRRGYTLSGAAVRVLPGDDAAEGAADSVRSLLLAEPVQNDLEAESDFSPVRLAGAAINREHRDVVAWFAASRGYRMITANLASHPVFDRLRQLLR